MSVRSREAAVAKGAALGEGGAWVFWGPELSFLWVKGRVGPGSVTWHLLRG